MIIYIRYRHIRVYCKENPSRLHVRRLNIAAFVVGLLTMSGVSIVGNFQVCTVGFREKRLGSSSGVNITG